MNHSHQPRLFGFSSIFGPEEKRVLRAIILPFEVLHRHRWSAPWETDQRA